MEKVIPREKIRQIAAKLNGTLGLFVQVLDTGETFQINPKTVFQSASVIKIPLLALLLKDVEEGKISWSSPRAISPVNCVEGSGVLKYLDKSYAPSLEVLALLMIAFSDNAAANEIIDVVGVNRFNSFWKDFGYKSFVLGRKMMDFEAIKSGKDNFMTVSDAGRLLVQIAEGSCISPWISRMVCDMMLQQQVQYKLPALLPVFPVNASDKGEIEIPKGTVLVANKTGELDGVQHDAGLFTLADKRQYIIAAFTKDLKRDSDGIKAISEISLAVYEALR